jgi:hypothetical protein
MSYSCHLRPDKNWNLTISYVPGTERQRSTATFRFSAIPNFGGLLKWLSVRTTGMSAPEGGTDIKSSKIGRHDWL